MQQIAKPSFWTPVRDFALFVRRPSIGPSPLTVPSAYRAMGVLFPFKYLLSFAVVFASTLMVAAVNRGLAEVVSYAPWLMVLLVAGVAPLIEEVAFRLPLRPRPLWLGLSAAVFSYYILTRGYYGVGNFELRTALVPRLLIPLALGLLIGFISQWFSRRSRCLSGAEELHGRRLTFVVYAQALLFGFVHIFNYDMPLEEQLLLWPIVVFPQLLDGFVYGFMRCRYGFSRGLVMHMINNAIGILPTLLLS